MNIETTYEKGIPPKRGRRSFDYSIFSTPMSVKVTGTDLDKIRDKVGNLVTGARRNGFSVRSYVTRHDDHYNGYVVRKGEYCSTN